jgi:RNA polymerase sigma-70 factor (ECF subfamily)
MTDDPPMASARAASSTQSALPKVPSFLDVYERYVDFAWASARRLGVEAESMDDVVQEVFIVVHQRLHTLERPEAIRSWIYGVVRRTVSHYHRARRAKSLSGAPVVDADSLETNVPTPFELTEQSGQVKLLETLLLELTPNQREVFVLAEIHELSAPEIAEALEIPLNTAYSRLRVARQMFDAALAQHTERSSKGEGK